jgi:hypothetical protein
MRKTVVAWIRGRAGTPAPLDLHLVMRVLVVGLIVLSALSPPHLQAQQPPLDGALNSVVSSPGLSMQLGWESARDAATVDQTKTGVLRRDRQLPFFKSLLIPGWGQLSKGQRTKAYAFFTAEALLISSIFAFKVYQGWLEDDYREFASQHAGIEGDRSHQYYVDIGNWMTTDEFNQQRLRDRAFDRLYNDPADQWQWDSDENRRHFKSTRLGADHAEQRAMLVLGGLILNHLLSAVDASGKSKKKVEMGVSSIGRNGVGLSLNFRR